MRNRDGKKITVAEYSGFCYGVKRAVKLLEDNLGGRIYTYGEIIHNPTVVGYFADRGVTVINSPEEADGGKVVIRSHGVGKDVLKRLSERAEVIDATCKFVAKIHGIVERKHSEGYAIVIVGQPDHPEVIGINGWCGGSATVVFDEAQARNIPPCEKLCVVCQTTFEKSLFEKILENIPKRHIKIVEVFDTICYTTIRRQQEAEKMASENDLMVVVGGKSSSNTAKLASVCKKFCKDVMTVEDADGLDCGLVRKHNKIGVAAGASTPKALIKEVFLKMTDMLENQDVTEETVAAGDTTTEETNGEMTMDDVMKSLDDVKFKRGQKVVATISDVKDDGLMLSIPGLKTDNFLAKEEVGYETEYNPADFNIGDPIEVKVVSTSPIKFSKRAIVAEQIEEQQITDMMDNKSEFTMTFNEVNKGGLIGKFGSWSVFVPASQIRIGYISDFEKYKGKPLRLEVIEADPSKRKLVASQKVILEREKQAKDDERAKREEEFWDNTHEGDIVEGKVVRISDFGAFVSVNGFDCLAHKSDLSWAPVESVESVLEKNKVYTFRVLKLDRESKRVSLGYKQLQPHPWESVAERYPIGSIVRGTVARIVGFGAFVELEKGVDGLVHVSQICHEWIENPESKLSVGQEVEAKVLDVDPENQKITLSLKALMEAPEQPDRRDSYDDGERRERPQRQQNNNNYGERKPRPRREQTSRQSSSDDDGPKAWIDSASSGASIGDMLKALNFDIDSDKEEK